MKRSLGVLGLVGVCGMASVSYAGEPPAAYILEVNITNPASVVVRSLGGASQITGGGTNYRILLRDLFVSDSAMGLGGISGSMTSSSGTGFESVAALSNAGFPGLMIYSGGGAIHTFTQGVQAVSGQFTFSATNAPLFSTPAVRDVVLLDEFARNTGQVIGQYIVVPAPASAALLGLGGLVALRRRR